MDIDTTHTYQGKTSNLFNFFFVTLNDLLAAPFLYMHPPVIIINYQQNALS